MDTLTKIALPALFICGAAIAVLGLVSLVTGGREICKDIPGEHLPGEREELEKRGAIAHCIAGIAGGAIGVAMMIAGLI